MKHFVLALSVLLITGCNAAPDAPAPVASPAAPAPAADATQPPMPPPMPAPAAEAKHASATGEVQSVDTSAQSLVIAHGPVDALGWPGMTMAFKAPGVDLSGIKAGDSVNFEFTTVGMDGTITSISKQ